MNNAPTGGRPTKNDRREQAREQARINRESAKKKERRNRILLQGGIIVAVLAVVAVIAIVIVSSVKPATPGPRNMASDGILIEPGGTVQETPGLEPGATPTPSAPTGAKFQIQTYVDYLCPYCGQFESTNAAYLRTLVESGAASLEIMPVAFLDRASAGSEYPSRAMNAVACVADEQPQQVYRFHELLFENQPQESTTGLTDDQIIELARQAGAKSATVETCIRNRTFDSWVKAATDRASAKITGTPTVIVNGQTYSGSLTDEATFRQFIAEAEGLANAEATPTPTPTPTPVPAG